MNKLAWMLPLLSAAACLPRQEYVYPVPLQQAPHVMEQHLQSCASDRAYSARQLMSMTWVNLDKDTLLIFDFASHEAPHFTVRQDRLIQSETEERVTFDRAKAAGDELLQCAHARAQTSG